MNRRPAAIASGVIVLFMLAVSAWAWPRIPDDARVPIHWGIDGQPNGWAPKWIALLITPGIGAVIALILGVIPAVEPRRANLARSSGFYLTAWLGALVLLAGVHVAAIAVALGTSLDIGRIAVVAVGLLFVLIGNVLPTTRSNFFAGIRTPWTLSSDRSWTVTHRAGGWGFVAIGAASVVLGLLGAPPEWLVGVLLGGMGLLVVALIVVSYRTWQTDPDRQTLGRGADDHGGSA
jgi:uncharacterized membrane protein